MDHVDEDGVSFKPSGDFGELVTLDHKLNNEKDEGCPYFLYESGKRQAHVSHPGRVHAVFAGLPSSS